MKPCSICGAVATHYREPDFRCTPHTPIETPDTLAAKRRALAKSDGVADWINNSECVRRSFAHFGAIHVRSHR